MITRRNFLAAATATVASASVVRRASAAVTLDLATVWPDGNFHTQNAVAFADAVGKATDGAVAITVQSGGALGFKGPEQLRAVRDGLVPMADVLNIQQIGDEPLLGTESIPFLVGSAEELKVLHKYLRPAYDEIAAKNNQKILYMVPWPTQYLHLKVKADGLAGLEGVKIRVPDKNAQDMCNALGMSAILMPWGEVVPALASGRVDGVSTSATSGVDGKFWEFLETIYPTNHVWSSQMVNINLDRWNEISPENREKIEALARDMEPGFWDVSVRNDKESLKLLTDNGMEVMAISPDMRAEMQARTAPLKDAFIERVPQAGPIVEAYLEELGRG